MYAKICVALGVCFSICTLLTIVYTKTEPYCPIPVDKNATQINHYFLEFIIFHDKV